MLISKLNCSFIKVRWSLDILHLQIELEIIFLEEIYNQRHFAVIHFRKIEFLFLKNWLKTIMESVNNAKNYKSRNSIYHWVKPLIRFIPFFDILLLYKCRDKFILYEKFICYDLNQKTSLPTDIITYNVWPYKKSIF